VETCGQRTGTVRRPCQNRGLARSGDRARTDRARTEVVGW